MIAHKRLEPRALILLRDRGSHSILDLGEVGAMRGEERVELRLLREVAKLDQERGLEIDTVEAIQCVRRRQSQVQRFVEGKRQRHWRVVDRKSTRLNSSHVALSRMPS